MSRLPIGWSECTLQDVADVVTGNTPPKSNAGNYGHRYPWVKPPDLSSDTPITTTAEKLSEEGAKRARLVPKGTTLVSCIGILGKVGISGGTVATNQQINSVVFNSSLVVPKYGFLYCKTLKPWLDENSSSTTVPIINKRRFSAAPFVLAPLNEQGRIVAKLEKLLSRVNAARERLATIPSILKRFRQSVIDSASAGALTVDWREGRDLELDQFNEKLGNLAKFIDYRGKTPKKTLDGIPLITAKNIRPGYLSVEPREYIAENNYDTWMTRGIPIVGDVLITTEAPLGYIVCIDWTFKFALAQRVICLQFDRDIVLGEYASLALQSTKFQSALNYKATGTTVSGIKASRLKELSISFPYREEQKEIIRRVEALFKTADTLEARYLKAKAHVDKLTQSILAKAFRGELVPQDPNDEPASVLLKRITVERNGSAVVKRRSRK